MIALFNIQRESKAGMIVSFYDVDTEALANGVRIPEFARIQSVARRKIMQLKIATRLEDLRVPPSNRLRPLIARRASRYAIHIDEHLYLRFYWAANAAEEVEITDQLDEDLE